MGHTHNGQTLQCDEVILSSILNAWRKTPSHIFIAYITQYGVAYNHSLMRVIPNHYSKQTHNSSLHTEKIPEAVLLQAFKVAFPALLFLNCQKAVLSRD